MYDATLGRFLQRDPLGAMTGSPNLYAYVGDMPTSAVDPGGMIPAPPRRPPSLKGELQCLADRAVLLGALTSSSRRTIASIRRSPRPSGRSVN